MKEGTSLEPVDIKIVKEYYEQLYANKFGSSDKCTDPLKHKLQNRHKNKQSLTSPLFKIF